MNDYDYKKLDNWWAWIPLPFALVWETLPKVVALPICIVFAPFFVVLGAGMGLLFTTLASMKK